MKGFMEVLELWEIAGNRGNLICQWHGAVVKDIS
jgi:hypothetical protein